MRYTKYFGDRKTQLEKLKTDGWQVVIYKNCSAVVAYHEIAGKVFLKAWRGKADKPAFYYSFQNQSAAAKYANQFSINVAASETLRANRNAADKAKRDALKASDHWTVGDVIYNSWGYDQTNVDWYQVVEVKPKSIVIREITRNYAEQSFMAGPSQPRRNEFHGEPILKPLDSSGHVSFRHGCGSKWDGRAVWESHYA